MGRITMGLPKTDRLPVMTGGELINGMLFRHVERSSGGQPVRLITLHGCSFRAGQDAAGPFIDVTRVIGGDLVHPVGMVEAAQGARRTRLIDELELINRRRESIMQELG